MNNKNTTKRLHKVLRKCETLSRHIIRESSGQNADKITRDQRTTKIAVRVIEKWYADVEKLCLSLIFTRDCNATAKKETKC